MFESEVITACSRGPLPRCFCSPVWSLCCGCVQLPSRRELRQAARSDKNWRALGVCVSRWLMHAAMFFFLPLPLLSTSFFFFRKRISPGVEQQGCFHGNTEASDWQSMVSVIPLPNPQNKLPHDYSKYCSFSVPSGGESGDPRELTQLHRYALMIWAPVPL